MTFKQGWLLLLIAPLVLWMIFLFSKPYTGSIGREYFGIFLLLAFGFTGLAPRKSMPPRALAQALTGVSDTDLKQVKRRIYVI